VRVKEHGVDPDCALPPRVAVCYDPASVEDANRANLASQCVLCGNGEEAPPVTLLSMLNTCGVDVPLTNELAESSPRLAVVIPCFNEERTIASVIEDFRCVVPTASVYVFDNNSTDSSAEIARMHGARVIPVSRQGNGHVVRAMLSRVSADVYIMVDGDDTYPARELPKLLAPVFAGRADMVVGARLAASPDRAYRPLHESGNRLFCWLVSLIFSTSLRDVLSGYRVFNAEIASGLPIVSSGFEIEAEMTIQCLYYGFTISEISIPYKERPSGSQSKLNTFRDGFRILMKITHLLRAYKPLTFFGSLGIVSILLAFLASTLIQQNMFGIANPFAPWIGAARDLCILAGGIFISTGIILHTLNYRVMELHSVLIKGEGRSR
jgi:hypothetical protein